MKWGGRDEITTIEAIMGLMVIAVVCLIASFWKSFRSLGLAFFGIAGVYIIILWQTELNSAYRKSRMVSQCWKLTDLCIFEHFKNQKSEGDKNAEKKTVEDKDKLVL